MECKVCKIDKPKDSYELRADTNRRRRVCKPCRAELKRKAPRRKAVINNAGRPISPAELAEMNRTIDGVFANWTGPTDIHRPMRWTL